ncbi:MAG: tRNA lysidine(34) synthetase TilS [Gammaproteobacteria bacterium]|nr:tRNA lysidine(34) synthetase TilS [Gammaproteobacteria bacterium]
MSSRNRSSGDRLSAASLLEWLTHDLPTVDHYCLAYSGGIDSTVLLHLLAEVREDLPAPLSAVHVDHGLHADSTTWAAHCAARCAALGVPCLSLTVDARPVSGQSPEAAARDTRYRAIAAELPRRSLLLTAHHRDDQAETLLLQLLRGSGVEGLAAMPRWRAWEQGWLGRPLLDFGRDEIKALAERRGMQWIDDPSNALQHADRNFLRHRVMPLLQSRWPSAPAAIARSAAHCGVAAESLREQVEVQLGRTESNDRRRLPLNALHGLAVDEAGRLLRAWLRHNGLDMPSTRRLEELRRQALHAGDDRAMAVAVGDQVVRRYRGCLWLTAARPPSPPVSTLIWQGDSADLGSCGRLERWLAPGGIDTDAWDRGEVSIVFRAPGMRLTPAGRQGSRTFKKLAQEYGVPPWLRESTPILTIDGQPAAVVGICVCEGFAARAGVSGWHIGWATV